jgi:hypothetical protein
MKFFLPAASNKEQAESVYANIADFINERVVPESQRLYSITYKHNGQTMVATVGELCDPYYKESKPTVFAIFKGNPYKVCLENRGVVRGEPIYVGDSSVISEAFFD